MRATVPVLEVPFNTDDCITKMGLDPVVVRESAYRTSRSLAEVISEAFGIEPREFARQIREMTNYGR